MKKIVSILCIVLVLCFTACGSSKIEITRNDEAIKPVQLSVPRELEGHMYVNLLSFDGQYGIFSVDRGDENSRETAELVVYNTITEKVTQYINVNNVNGIVTEAVKQGDWLYYIIYYPDENRYVLQSNDGMETAVLLENVTEKAFNSGIFFEAQEESFLVCRANADSANEKYVYDFYTVTDGQLTADKIHSYISNVEMNIIDVKYDREQNEEYHELDLWEITIEKNNKIYVYKWDGAYKDTMFMGPVVDSAFVKVMGDWVFHYTENSANSASYRMLTATNTVEDRSADIDFVNMHGFYSVNDSYGVYKYDTPEEKVMEMIIDGMNIQLTPVEIDLSDSTRTDLAVSGDNCLVKVQRGDSAEVELYIFRQ